MLPGVDDGSELNGYVAAGMASMAAAESGVETVI